MKCASALSTTVLSATAFSELVDRVAEGLDGQTASMALAFVSPHHAEALESLASLSRDRGVARHILGVTGDTIVGDGREVEGEPSASLWAIQLPENLKVRPVRLTWSDDPSLPVDMPRWGQAHRTLVLLADPYSYPADQLFEWINKEAPGLRVVGGMASGSNRPGGNRLLLDQDVYSDGAVGSVLDGPVD